MNAKSSSYIGAIWTRKYISCKEIKKKMNILAKDYYIELLKNTPAP